jgi:hypothetical protein
MMNNSAPQNPSAYSQKSAPYREAGSSPKPPPTMVELVDVVTPYLLRMLKEHPIHGCCALKLNFRDSHIAFLGIESSVTFLPGTNDEYEVVGGK